VSQSPYVQIRDLRRAFDVSKPWLNRVLEGGEKQFLKAVDGVSFDIAKGETFALVGESGSGKSTVARMVVGLLPPTSGEVTIDGISMTSAAAAAERQRLRRRIQMIFQDPYASLNPRWRVDQIVAEPIRAFRLLQGEGDIRARVGELLTLVCTRTTAANTRMNSPAASASASPSPGPSLPTPSSSSATSRPPPSMSASRPRSST
jgi:peptide/nickel transport system ATP-binding protein